MQHVQPHVHVFGQRPFWCGNIVVAGLYWFYVFVYLCVLAVALRV